MTMVDLNGDGRPDFITGKLYIAHTGIDPASANRLGSTGMSTSRNPMGPCTG
jgi:hypothetical protein